eukprot:snap_masked-scaffold_11-processed-gene-10.33-mRNA-1 protein AED:0.20 eAED:1.00 QI:0/-1/0/1/-1/1/1/0/367
MKVFYFSDPVHETTVVVTDETWFPGKKQVKWTDSSSPITLLPVGDPSTDNLKINFRTNNISPKEIKILLDQLKSSFRKTMFGIYSLENTGMVIYLLKELLQKYKIIDGVAIRNQTIFKVSTKDVSNLIMIFEKISVSNVLSQTTLRVPQKQFLSNFTKKSLFNFQVRFNNGDICSIEMGLRFCHIFLRKNLFCSQPWNKLVDLSISISDNILHLTSTLLSLEKSSLSTTLRNIWISRGSTLSERNVGPIYGLLKIMLKFPHICRFAFLHQIHYPSGFALIPYMIAHVYINYDQNLVQPLVQREMLFDLGKHPALSRKYFIEVRLLRHLGKPCFSSLQRILLKKGREINFTLSNGIMEIRERALRLLV